MIDNFTLPKGINNEHVSLQRKAQGLLVHRQPVVPHESAPQYPKRADRLPQQEVTERLGGRPRAGVKWEKPGVPRIDLSEGIGGTADRLMRPFP